MNAFLRKLYEGNLKKQDEIIVSPRSFIISSSCTLNLGLKPIFADVDENGNLNI